MKRLLFFFWLSLLFFPSVFALLDTKGIQTFDYKISEDASAHIDGTAVDEEKGILYAGVNLEKPKREPKRIDYRILTVDLVSQEVIDSVDVPRESFGSVSGNESWDAESLVRTPDGRLFGLFGKRALGAQLFLAHEALESAVFELPAPQNWKTDPSVKRMSPSKNTVHHGLIYYNGNLYTATKQKNFLNEKWGLTRIDLATGEEKFFETENGGELHHIWNLAVSPNGTVVAEQFETGKGKEILLVYELQPNRLKLLQKIEYAPLKLGLPFVGGVSSLLAEDDFFVVGTTANYLETYRKKGELFELQPKERVVIGDPSTSQYGIMELALASNRLVSVQSYQDNTEHQFGTAPLEKPFQVAKAPNPAEVSPAAKAVALEKSPVAEQPPISSLAANNHWLIKIDFGDEELKKQIQEKNDFRLEDSPTEVLQGLQIKLGDRSLEKEKDFFVQPIGIVLKEPESFIGNSPQNLDMAFKIAKFDQSEGKLLVPNFDLETIARSNFAVAKLVPFKSTGEKP